MPYLYFNSHGWVGTVPDKQLQLGQDREFLSVHSAWDRALEALGERVNKPSFESWIKTARPISIDGSTVRVGTTSRFAKHWLENKHLAFLKEMLESELGFKVKLELELLQEPKDEPPILKERLPKKPRTVDEEPISQPFNKYYTFENFVVGPTNRLAHACAMAIAEEPGRTYNPLFIYGGPGLGKTHLMQAIGHYVSEQQPDMRVAYVSGETFTFHYINSLREHSAAEFRRKYRSIDLWLVDDIQFLAGKERTEEEFFHTYNAIHDLGKQVVLTSDRAPKDLELDERLLSRFEMGMLADISPPDFETRVAILQTKATTENMPLSDEVIIYIARLITRDIRELQGALIKLHAYASLMKTSVTQGLAEEVLSKYFGDGAITVIDAQKVQKEVAGKFSVDVCDLKGKCRSKDIVTPRQVAMYLLRELTDFSLPAIGRVFGGRDHSTVLHACRRIEERIAHDRAFAALVAELSRRISGERG